MRIGYLGPKGTYTEEAADKFILQRGILKCEKVPVSSIKEVFESLNKQEIEAAVVPLKNSIAGDYNETNICLQKYLVSQVSSIKLRINLTIGIHPDSIKEDITEIHSKDTALKECDIYLKTNFPNAHKIEVESTAQAMKDIIENNQRNIAAIGSKSGMKVYSLKIIGEDIADKKDNVTTFLYLVKRK